MNVAVGVPQRLVVRTTAISAPDDLVARLPHAQALAWVRHGEGLVGWGEAARLVLPGGEDRFTRASGGGGGAPNSPSAARS